MAEFTTIEIINPTSEDFTHNFNGEPYTLPSKRIVHFPKAVAFHLAKHLSTKIIIAEKKKGVPRKKLEDIRDRIQFEVSRLAIHDTPERRIALYKMFKNESYVIEVIKQYPFKDIIGDMEIYTKFVEGEKSGESKPTEKDIEPKTEDKA